MTVESCIHIANLFYLASYLCRDMLWLRVLTCLGLAFGIVFFCCQAEAMFAPASWMGVFLAVNIYQIFRILQDRDEMRLSRRQEVRARRLLRDNNREQLLTVLTRSMCEHDRDPKLLEDTEQIELTKEESIVRNLAFDRLSDAELANLIVRRFWGSTRPRRNRRSMLPRFGSKAKLRSASG